MAFNGLLFDRKYEMRVQISDTTDLQVTDLNVLFSITRTLRKEPNDARIEVYNLNRTHRAQIESQKDMRLTFLAGYAGQLSTLFLGQIRRAHTVRENENLITIFEAGDAEKKMRRGRLDKSFGSGTPIKQVLKDLARAMGVGDGNLSKVADQMVIAGSKVFARGTTTTGSASDEMTGLLDSSGFTWSVQNDNLQIVRRGAALEGTAVVLNADTGLIGSPQLDEKGQLKCDTLLIRDIFPGRKIQLALGVFVVDKCEYVGELDGGEWGIKIEAKPLK